LTHLSVWDFSPQGYYLDMGIESKVTFVVDISREVGKGHFSRCKALYEHILLSGLVAEEINWLLVGLTDSDLKQDFSDLNRSRIQKVISTDLNVDFLSLETQWVVIDLPKIDFRAYKNYLPARIKTILIVDRPIGTYEVDILVAPNLFKSGNFQSIMDLNKNSVCLIGPEWFPLRPEFYKKQITSPKTYSNIYRVKVGAYFGGLDAENQIDKVYKASQILNSAEIQFDLVAGSESRLVMNSKSLSNIEISLRKSNFPEYLNSCDLFIGSLGVSAWERSYLRIPTITSFQNNDQIEDYEVMMKLDAIYGIGHAEEYSSTYLAEVIERLLLDQALLESLKTNSHMVMRKSESKASYLISQILNID
jgi:UDP-2,4-diacetamido-2,4,6-trideoxy-beta-L-altropyranose hydrolase